MKTCKRFWLTALVALVLGAIALSIPMFMITSLEEPIGIIGGADTPTYLFLASTRCGGLFTTLAYLAAVVAVIALLLWLYHALSKPDGLRKGSVCAALFGATLGCGIYCGLNWVGIVLVQAAFGEGSRYPYEFAGSTLGILAVLVIGAILIWEYAHQKSQTTKAVLADFLLLIVSAIITFPLWGMVHEVLSWLIHWLGL